MFTAITGDLCLYLGLSSQSYSVPQVRQKLKDHLVAENITATWRKQPDKKVFHKKKEREDCCEVLLCNSVP